MGDTTSDQDTFVSIENYMCTPQPIPSPQEEQNPHSDISPRGGLDLTEDVYGHGNIEQRLSSGQPSAHPTVQSASQMEDHSSFMWNLYVPETGDLTADIHDSEHTLEIPGNVEDNPDPSDLCGEFNTSAMKKKSFARIQKPQFHSKEQGAPLSPENQQCKLANLENNEASPPPSAISPQETEEVLLNATNGIISYKMENPFQSSEPGTSPFPGLILYSSMGSLTNEELSFWNTIAEYPLSSESLVFKRFIETVQFQRKQVQDLKAAEIQIASATLQVERRRHSEVEHERSAAIATLMEQLSEEGEQRASLEEENAKLRALLAEVQTQNEEVLNYFTQLDKDFTLSDGVENALNAALDNLSDVHERDVEKIQEQKQRLEETEARLHKTEKVAEARLRRTTDLEYINKQLEAELRSFSEGLRDLPSQGPSSNVSIRAETLEHENDDLRSQFREMDREMEQLKSSLRVSRAEQTKVNDALLSMNVELEDSKRRLNALRRHRDSVEAKHRNLVQSAASDRDRFYKFQSEMSRNFANAVNEIEERQTEVHRLQNELDDRDKAFQLQTSTINHLQEQLQAITDSVLEQNNTKRGGSKNDHEENSLTATVIQSMKEEVSKAQGLLKERGEEIEGLRQQMYAKDELLASAQLECTKLKTAASVRRITSRMSQGPSAHIEQHQSAFLRRLSETLRSQPKEDGEVLQKLTERIDTLCSENKKFEEVKRTLVDEVKQREHALLALRAEMAAEIAALKADVRHQETLRIRAQDNRKELEKKCNELLETKKLSVRESFGDVTSSSLGIREWSLADDCEGESRRGSVYSTIRDEDGVRWKDPIIEGAVRSLNALIGTKDDLWARNRELKEKLENILKSMGISDEEGKRLRSLLMQSKDFQDELTRIVDMQQDILGNITGSGFDGDQSILVDDTLPYLRRDLNPGNRVSKPSESESHTIGADEKGLVDSGNVNETGPALQKTRGEAAQFLREQLNESRALCNEKLKVNVQLYGVLSELKQEVKHLTASNCVLESALSGIKETHEGFVSRLALLTGTEQSAVAVEDCMRTVMRKVADTNAQVSALKARENSLKRRVTCLIAQKHVLTHIIDVYQSKYKLDFLADTQVSGSSRQRFRKCVFSVIALGKMSQLATLGTTRPSSVLDESYDVPGMAAIGKYRVGTTSLHGAVIAIEAMPRLERALVEKNGEIAKLQGSVKGLERSLSVLTESAKTVTHELPTSFLYKDDIMNRKNDMARRLRVIIQEKEDLDDRLSKEKQARIAAEARSTRYLDKISIMKRKLGKVASNAESKERTYKAAIMYLKGKAEKANDNHGELDENVDPFPSDRQVRTLRDKSANRKHSLLESRAVLEQELKSAEMELVNLEAGSDEYEKKSQYVKGLYGGIQRLEKPMLSDHSAHAPAAQYGDQAAH